MNKKIVKIKDIKLIKNNTLNKKIVNIIKNKDSKIFKVNKTK